MRNVHHMFPINSLSAGKIDDNSVSLCTVKSDLCDIIISSDPLSAAHKYLLYLFKLLKHESCCRFKKGNECRFHVPDQSANRLPV